MDYEAVEPELSVSSKPKNFNEFYFAATINPTETEPIPNLAGVGRFTELGEWKIPNGLR